MTYLPHSLTQADPATVEYQITIGANTYSSGPLPFDQGNPNEDPPHGQYGMLVPHYAGGYFQPNVTNGTGDLDATFENICFEKLDVVVPTKAKSWGELKLLYR
jgi:hypothetical protein